MDNPKLPHTRGYYILQAALARKGVSSDAVLPQSDSLGIQGSAGTSQLCPQPASQDDEGMKATQKSSAEDVETDIDMAEESSPTDSNITRKGVSSDAVLPQSGSLGIQGSAGTSQLCPQPASQDDEGMKATQKYTPEDEERDHYMAEESSLSDLSGCEWKPGSSDNSDIVSDSEDSDNVSIVFPLLMKKGDCLTGCGKKQSSETIVESVQGVDVGTETKQDHVDAGGERGQVKNMKETKKTSVTLSSRTDGKYKWDKKHCCKFCHKLVLKMSTHMQDVHEKEPEVARILAMEKGSLERRQAWIGLQDEGDYLHNVEVLEKKSGCVIPKYRTKGSRVEDLLACSFCKGLYQKKVISVHAKHCHQKPSQCQPAKRGHAAKLGRLMLPVPLDVEGAFYQQILARQKEDDIRHIIQNDSLLLEFGKRQFDRRDIEEHTAGQISSRMRELGRLMKILQNRSQLKVSCLNDVINATHFDELVLAVKELAGFDSQTHQFQKGHLAMRIGHALKKCSQIKQSRASKNLGSGSDEVWQREISEAQRFDSVFTGDWYDCVSGTAAQSVGRMTMNKPKLIPSCEDVTKVNKLLEKKMFSRDYTTLVKATLCAVSLFNRKRGGELQRMKISDFQLTKTGMTTNEDILKGLTEVEKKMVKYFQRVEIRGKFNRPVPVLLTKTMINSMERILHMRQAIPAVATSQYIFATPSGQRPYRGHDVLKEFAVEAQVSNPAIFTFTQLRKQIATLAQAMAITELDQDQLADFLGHDIRIHRHIYRQPQELLQKAKVAKILLSVNNGMTDFETCIRDELADEEIDFDDKPSGTCSKVSAAPVPEKQKTRSKKRSLDLEETTDSSEDNDASIPLKKKARFTRKPWGKDEQLAVQTHFKNHLILKKMPGKMQIQHVMAEEPTLRNRRWTNIKDYVRNMLRKS